jgi:Transglycosylase SLT domain
LLGFLKLPSIFLVRSLFSALLFFSIGEGIAQTQTATPEPTSVSPLSASQQAALDLVNRGLRYEHAEGVVRDLLVAHDSYCMAARMNFAEGFIRLGWMYANGRGVARNDAIASSLFQRAATLGDEMGKRLSEMIRSDREELPSCLTANQFALKPITPTLPSAAADTRASTKLPALPQLPKVTSFANLSAAERGKFATLVSTMAKDFRLDPRLVLAVMKAESNYDPLARSPKGAQGLMQLIPETAERFGVKDSTEPSDNIRGGMAYLKWLLSFFRGNVVLALAAYNAGEKTIEKFNGVPPYPETMAYVQRIRSVYPVDFHSFDERAAAYRPDKPKSLKK